MRIKACEDNALDQGEAIKLDLDPPIAVIRGESGEIFAIDDTCTHATASLSEGFVEGDFIECPLHASMFCLKSGKPDNPPARDPVMVHKVVIEDGSVFIEVDR